MMKDHIGQEVFVRVDGTSIQGTLIDDQQNRIIIQESDNVVTIIKSHISFFMIRGQKKIVPRVKSGLDLLAVVDDNGKEIGVYYVTDGGTLVRNEATFRSACGLGPANKVTNLGDIFRVSKVKLKEIFGGMILGDMPKEVNSE